MFKKILAPIVALLAVLIIGASAQSASANHLLNNRVTYAGGGPVTCGSNNYIYLDKDHPYATYDYVIRPCSSSYPTLSTVSCFIPTRTLYSYWNGVYYANAVRCFGGSNNNLTLYAYMH